MQSLLNTWKTSRNIYADLAEKYSLDQLNHIPSGFSNNLIWNIGHVIVAQQSLVYRLSGLDMYITQEMMDAYKPGSVPTGTTTAEEVATLKSLLLSLVTSTEADLASGHFTSFTARTTATGFQLASLEDALHFNNFHEGTHLGMMLNIRKFI